MYNSAQTYLFTIPAGTLEFTDVLNVPTNGNLGLIDNFSNSKIKYISAHFCIRPTNNFIVNWSIRFQGLNRDGSFITENAGIIQNTISGDWGNAFIKDTILDFVLTSKKNQIYFDPNIEIGGYKPRTVSFKFNSALAANTVLIGFINVNYE